ncbi:MAG: hypothetical protein HQL45_13545 [Alphaproteobacteria bacterium]|nr:hypothetical protein [Alphaproteobacteria bacterium]
MKNDDAEKISRILLSLPTPSEQSRCLMQAPQLSQRALAVRARAAGGSEQFLNGTHAVVKNVGQRYSQSGSKETLRYIAREREKDKRLGALRAIQLYDEYGLPLSHDQARRIIEGWPEDGDEGSVHTWHIIFSLPADDVLEIKEKFRKVCRDTVDSVFADDFYNVIWTIHDDKLGRLHAHILLRASRDFGTKWRFDKHGDAFDTLRAEFAYFANKQGFRVNASRREDRAQLRRRIAWGEEPLRTPRSRTGWHYGSTQPEVRTPNWFKTYGNYIQHPKASPSVFAKAIDGFFMRPQKQKLDDHPFLEHFAKVYKDPHWSFSSFVAMSQDGADAQRMGYFLPSKFALWNLLKRPRLFGPLRDDVPIDNVLKALVSKLRSTRRLGKAIDRSPAPRQSLPSEKQVLRDRKMMQRSLTRLAGLDEAVNLNEARAQKIREEAARIDREPLYIRGRQTDNPRRGEDLFTSPNKPKPRAEPPPSSGGMEVKKQPPAPLPSRLADTPIKRTIRRKLDRDMN